MRMRTGSYGLQGAMAVVLSCWTVHAAADLRVSETDTSVTIETTHYTAVVAKDKGMTFHSLADRRTKREMRVQQSGLIATEERERPTWVKAGFGQPSTHRESAATVQVQVEAGPTAATLVGTWSNAAVDVRKTVTFMAGSPVIDVSYMTTVTRPLEQLAYTLDINDAVLSREGRFYPGPERHVARMPVEAAYALTPTYSYCTDGKTGVGLLASGRDDAETVAHMTYTPSLRRTHLAAYTRPLRWDALPRKVELSVGIVIGVPPEDVAALHRTRNPTLSNVQITRLNVGHLIQKTSETGQATVVLTNHAATVQTITLTAQVTGGIATSRNLQEQVLQIPANSTREASLSWPNEKEYGFELLVDARSADGTLLDSAREVFAVADHFVKVAQTTVWNAGWMRYDWLTPAMVRQAKECYVGIIEYYCWAPDQVFDLTPDTETWEPHTESQGAYRTELTRAFLRGVVDSAHSNGLRVLAMDTGFASLPGALDHPKRVKYTRDGQMYLYNGNIHNGKRFNAVGAYVHEPELTKAWAEEMCASVDMFGWDGVRFDWNFIPVAPQDPLHMAAANKGEDIYARANKQAWYTWDGRSAHDLFPDPDRAGAELCGIYRETVAEKHPDFIYNVNYSVNHGLFDSYPEYSKVNTKNAGILMESLLNTYSNYPTWQAWATVLTDALSVVRPQGAQPFVGWMRGYAPGGIAHRNMQYIMMASGFRWYGPYGARYSPDDTYRRFRHATRFAEFFYDPGFSRLQAPETRVQLTGDGADRVLWEPFVFERTAPGRRELLVHLLNLPKDDHIIMHHDLPTVKRNLVVTATWHMAFPPQSCWLLTPEPRPHAVELPWRTGPAGTVTVHIPELASLGSLVLSGKGEYLR